MVELNPVKIIAKNGVDKLIQESKNAKSYNSGLFGEHYLVSAIKQMPTSDKEKLRLLITKMIREDVKVKAIRENKKNN